MSALQRLPQGGWSLALAEAPPAGEPPPPGLHVDHVVLAMPPLQAAALLAPHHAAWSAGLRRIPMNPCWTLMAVSDARGLDDLDWDALAPDPASASPLAWVSRNDRRPGRATPPGCASWVAQAGAEWSQQHLEDAAEDVTHVLSAALQAAIGRPLGLRHTAVHRWRYALPAATSQADAAPWWDAGRGLGVCGDSVAGGDIEAAWLSGDALARAMIQASPGR